MPVRVVELDYNRFTDGVYWLGGNVTYVPLLGDLQTYVNNASPGDTLILASGEYVLTSGVTLNKQINIVGQGNAGFYTTPIAPAHGTVISSTTGGVTTFEITSSNVRLAHMSVNLKGNTSLGIDTGNNLRGLVFNNIDLLINCSGWAAGFTVNNSDVIMRDLTFYIASTNFGATGVVFNNDSFATGDNVCDCFNVTGTVKGKTINAFCYLCNNDNSAHTVTLNLSNSVCKSLAGTPLDCAVAATSTTTNNAVVNAYMCNFDGADYDAYQTGSNQLNIGGSVLVNNRVSGSVTYRTTMAAGTGVFSQGVIHGILASAPASPLEGWMYVNSVDNKVYMYYGGVWQVLHTLTPAAPAPILGGVPYGMLAGITYPADGGG